jgi:hypothetical protein
MWKVIRHCRSRLGAARKEACLGGALLQYFLADIFDAGRNPHERSPGRLPAIHDEYSLFKAIPTFIPRAKKRRNPVSLADPAAW